MSFQYTFKSSNLYIPILFLRVQKLDSKVHSLRDYNKSGFWDPMLDSNFLVSSRRCQHCFQKPIKFIRKCRTYNAQLSLLMYTLSINAAASHANFHAHGYSQNAIQYLFQSISSKQMRIYLPLETGRRATFRV